MNAGEDNNLLVGLQVMYRDHIWQLVTETPLTTYQSCSALHFPLLLILCGLHSCLSDSTFTRE